MGYGHERLCMKLRPVHILVALVVLKVAFFGKMFLKGGYIQAQFYR